LKPVVALIMAVLAASCASVDAERSEPFVQTAAQAAALGVLSNITALEMLHSGDRESAMDLLDDALDVNIAILIEKPLSANVPGRERHLRRAAEYRAKHPRRSPSRVDAYLKEYLREKQAEGK
jgi:hypothetical protein